MTRIHLPWDVVDLKHAPATIYRGLTTCGELVPREMMGSGWTNCRDCLAAPYTDVPPHKEGRR